MSEPSLICFTAIFGKIRDELKSLQHLQCDPKHVAFHAYVDGVTLPEKHSTGWELRPAVWEHATNPRLRARRHKLLSHKLYPNAEHTLWLDGCLTPKHDPSKLIEDYMTEGSPGIFTFRHMQRNCIYQECEACVRLKKDNLLVLRHLAKRYKAEGYPHNNGLAETTAMLRANTPEVNRFNELWWDELRSNSIRDQMSFNYLIWKHDLTYGTFLGRRVSCPHFSWTPHR